MTSRAVAVVVLAGILGLAVPLESVQAQGTRSRELRKERKEKAEKQAIEDAAQRRLEVQDLMPPEGTEPDPQVAELYAQLFEGGNHEAIRICYDLAIQAIEAGRRDEAKRLLDGVIWRLEASSAGDESAKDARSTFRAEDTKNFRGEPYEQAMFYHLRGLMYMEEGDFENARAIFRSGALRDRSSLDAKKDEQFNDDLAMVDYLEALCNAKTGSSNTEESLRFAREHARNPGAVVDPPTDFNSVLVFYSGLGPRKFRTGEYLQFLRFTPGSGAGGPIVVQVDGNDVAHLDGNLDSLTFQATTRGGREIDAVLKGKAQFKTGASVVGDLAIGAGASIMSSGNSDDAPYVGAIISLIGIGAKIASAKANPEADARMLSAVPDDFYIIPVSIAPGQHEVTVRCPTTGVSHRFDLDRTDAPFAVHLEWKPEFGTNVLARRQTQYKEEVAELAPGQAQRWIGEFKPRGEDEIPAELLITTKSDINFSGYLVVEPGDTAQFRQVRGKIDDDDFQMDYLEVATAGYVNTTRFIGKTKKKGNRVTGDLYSLSSEGMYPLGRSFELEIAKAEETPKPKSERPARGSRRR